MLHGVDISAYQSGPPAGKDFYLIKATEGTSYVDSHLGPWLDQVEKWGALSGAYHFGHPEHDNPIGEADFFVATMRPHMRPDTLVFLDHETSTYSPSHDAAWAREFCARVQSTLKRPGVYCNQYFAISGRCEGLGGYPLWLARYFTISDTGVGPWPKATFQQYTDRPMDEDVFFGDRAAWLALASGGTNPSTGGQTDMPEYLSVSRREPETGGPGERTLHFDVTFDDSGKLRNPDKATPGICDGGRHGAMFVADLNFAAAAAGTAWLVEVDPQKDWAVTKAYPRHPIGAPFTVAGCVSPGQHLWVRVECPEGVAGTARVLYWPR